MKFHSRFIVGLLDWIQINSEFISEIRNWNWINLQQPNQLMKWRELELILSWLFVTEWNAQSIFDFANHFFLASVYSRKLFAPAAIYSFSPRLHSFKRHYSFRFHFISLISHFWLIDFPDFICGFLQLDWMSSIKFMKSAMKAESIKARNQKARLGSGMKPQLIKPELINADFISRHANA